MNFAKTTLFFFCTELCKYAFALLRRASSELYLGYIEFKYRIQYLRTFLIYDLYEASQIKKRGAINRPKPE
jgi:hypothetical protein